MKSDNVPWVEKYRPTSFNKIVIEPINKKIMQNIVETGHFPNVLFYGPPGTGKTTTVINLINAYQLKHHQSHKALMIHLNASDDRGIDIIRNQISAFVKTSGLFINGLKFVILDEVDYMTKNAQQALKHLLETNQPNVRYCLICNYITRVDESLRNKLVGFRFNELPYNDIVSFLENVSDNEFLHYDTTILSSIQQMHGSDIRSMINYMQAHRNLSIETVVENQNWMELQDIIMNNKVSYTLKYIKQKAVKYNICEKAFIKRFIVFMLNNEKLVTHDMLTVIANFTHNIDCEPENLITYFVLKTSELLKITGE